MLPFNGTVLIFWIQSLILQPLFVIYPSLGLSFSFDWFYDAKLYMTSEIDVAIKLLDDVFIVCDHDDAHLTFFV